MTQEEVKAQFLLELKALLTKWDAEIEAQTGDEYGFMEFLITVNRSIRSPLQNSNSGKFRTRFVIDGAFIEGDN